MRNNTEKQASNSDDSSSAGANFYRHGPSPPMTNRPPLVQIRTPDSESTTSTEVRQRYLDQMRRLQHHFPEGNFTSNAERYFTDPNGVPTSTSSNSSDNYFQPNYSEFHNDNDSITQELLDMQNRVGTMDNTMDSMQAQLEQAERENREMRQLIREGLAATSIHTRNPQYRPTNMAPDSLSDISSVQTNPTHASTASISQQTFSTRSSTDSNISPVTLFPYNTTPPFYGNKPTSADRDIESQLPYDSSPLLRQSQVPIAPSTRKPPHDSLFPSHQHQFHHQRYLPPPAPISNHNIPPQYLQHQPTNYHVPKLLHHHPYNFPQTHHVPTIAHMNPQSQHPYQPYATAKPSQPDPWSQQLLQQNQQMMSMMMTWMQQQQHQKSSPTTSSSTNDDKLQLLTNAISNWSTVAQAQADTAKSSLTETKKARESAGPKDNKFVTFTGKENEDFAAWYNTVLAKLALAEWSPLYDQSTNDIIPATTEATTVLSSHLYAALMNCLKQEAQRIMSSTAETLRGKGVELLLSMIPVYRPTWPYLTLQKKKSEFSDIFRREQQTIDEYAAIFKACRRDLLWNNTVYSDEDIRIRFIISLGPDFEDLHKNMDNLPSEWQTTNLESLVMTARNYLANLRSIKERSKEIRAITRAENKTSNTLGKVLKNVSNGNGGGTPKSDSPPGLSQTEMAKRKEQSERDKAAHQKTLQEGEKRTPDKQEDPRLPFQIDIMKEIGNGKHTTARRAYWQAATKDNYCCYHRNDQHTSHDCWTMNHALTKADNPTNVKPGPLSPVGEPKATNKRVKHDMSDSPNPFDILVQDDDSLNDYNQTVEEYFDPTNHKIVAKLAKVLDNPSTTPPQHTRFVIDSGANRHMCSVKALFLNMRPYKGRYPSVTLGDGSTECAIEGVGDIVIQIMGHTILLSNVLFVPTLECSLFSIKMHMKFSGNYFHAQDNRCTLAFPTFTCSPTVGDEIEIEVSNATTTNYEYDERDAELSSTIPITNTIPVRVKRQYYEVGLSSLTGKKHPEFPPSRATPGSIGYDLFSPIDTSIPPNSRKAVPIGIRMDIPPGLYGRIAPRSGLAAKHGIDVAAGVIDPDYRGEIKVLLVNTSQKKFQIKKGDKIAQMIFERAALPAIRFFSSLTDTVRGQGGFGSTDKAKIAKIIEEVTTTNTSTPSPFMEPVSPAPNIVEPDDNDDDDSVVDVTPLASPSPSSFPHVIPPETHSSPASADTITISSVPLQHKIPNIRPQDKVPSTEPSVKNMTVEDIRRGFGFQSAERLLPLLKETCKDNFHVASIERELSLDLGEIATIDKPSRNTNPVPLPENLGDVVHVDIAYGSKQGIGGTRYALLLVDRATRSKYIYGMKNLTDDLVSAGQQFLAELGFAPKTLIADFDMKLIGGAFRNLFVEKGTNVLAAPPKSQNENGLVERSWRSIVRMARGWLASSLLPASFWFYAVKRACEVSNYLPLKSKGILTSSFELVHHQKPDLRTLFPMFSVAYIDKEYDGDEKKENLVPQSLKCIAIGRDSRSHCLQFYHPPSKKIIPNNAYRLDPTLAAGPVFNLSYDGGLFFNRYDNEADTLRPPGFDLHTKVFYKQIQDDPKSKYHAATIIAIPLGNSDIYTVKCHTSSNIHELPAHRLMTALPDAALENNPSLSTTTLPSWANHEAKVTLFLPGYVNFTSIYKARRTKVLQETVVQHVSAANLKSMDTPTLLNLHKFCPEDKELWKKGYDEEYDGLQNLPCWNVISEQEYLKIKPVVGNALPTMAISTLKYDENGKPKRVKWRIVALGNLDPHEWSKSEVYAPVLSTLSLRFLASLAVYHGRPLRNGDVKQAFVQSVLPSDEKYVVKPPPGCPRTPTGSYWLLIRALYGLKRAPRHWFEKATILLRKCGLKPLPNDPCLFVGSPDGKHKLYLGLYVDDFVYFSESRECEIAFEKKFSETITVDFMGPVTHFLGLKFAWNRHDDGHLDVHISQEAFAENLVEMAGLSNDSGTTNLTPYRSGCPIDTIPVEESTPEKQKIQETKMRSLVGSLLWLSQSTRPDLSTVTSLLAQHQANPSPGHIRAARHVIKYVKGTKSRGITFSSRKNSPLESFLNFPVKPNTVIPFTDANWGPQDQSKPKLGENIELELFKSRSLSGFLIMFNGPLHWSATRQRITARSSAEAEIYATDECVKELLRLRIMINDLELNHIFFPTSDPTTIYNDNMACVHWSKSKTTKGLRHITIRENAIREAVSDKIVSIKHIAGAINLADIFTKEIKDPQHFITIRDHIATLPPKQTDNAITGLDNPVS